ncbi:hypothetical protein KG088_17425 [Halomonas sp. TRM85114]|uniref:hypothetical protein n=1 Tax=Halomonas jincaotanensis TaxID=2810616 RepID=UPI001BD490AF|nr:hypothetical protein [Halomonas jincaotanensis]MBS9405391.1 hypothetical protein [Halomonas jincaotanensis]
MNHSEFSTSSDATESTGSGTDSPTDLQALRVNIATIVGRYFLPLLIVTMLFAVFLIVIIGTRFVTDDTAEKMALASSVQVAFGMIIGYVCIYIGLMMTWFGIEAAYSVQGALGAEHAKGEISLRSASPGLFFALGGMILIAACLYKPIEYRAEVPITARDIPVMPPAGNAAQERPAAVEAKPPPPLEDEK